MFLYCHLGLWVWDDYRCRCWILSLTLLNACFGFDPLFYVSRLVFWSKWTCVLLTGKSSGPVGIFDEVCGASDSPWPHVRLKTFSEVVDKNMEPSKEVFVLLTGVDCIWAYGVFSSCGAYLVQEDVEVLGVVPWSGFWASRIQLSHLSASWLMGPTLELIYITLCFTESGLKLLIFHTVTSIKNENINNCCQNFLTLFMILNPFHCVSKTTVRNFGLVKR